MTTKHLNVERFDSKDESRPLRSTLYGTPPQAAKGIMGRGDCTINHLRGIQDPNVLCGGWWIHPSPSGKSLTSYNFRHHSTVRDLLPDSGDTVPHFLSVQDIQVGTTLLS